MGLCVEESISGLTIGQARYEAALIIAVLRWVFCWVSKVIKDRRSHSPQTPTEPPLSSSTFGEMVERVPETLGTCAVCLNRLTMEDEVRELMNCDHVFHRECIDRWLDHDQDNHNPTCPPYKALLLTSYCSSNSENSSCVPPSYPSWAVERLLYLFGDDLPPC